MTVSLFIEQVVNGLITGSIYALLGSGLALIYGTMRILNFAHGEMYMLGGYFVFFAVSALALPFYVAIPLAMLAVFIIGAGVERIVIAPILKQEGWIFSAIAVTLGLSIFLQNFALHVWGEQFQTVPYVFKGMMVVGDVRLPWQRVAILVVSLVVIAAGGIVLRYTRMGRAIRATAQDAEAAAVLGIPARRVYTFTFAAGSALAALAAGMLIPIYAVSPWMGAAMILKAFAVVILGGLGSFAGAVVAGFLLGIVEAIGITLTSSQWGDVISYSVLILVICVRPWGLFGVRER